MNSIQTFIYPILVGVVVILILVSGRRRMANWEKQNANFRLSELASRMRLSIVEGDPNFNLMTASTNHDMKNFNSTGGFLGAMAGDGTKESRARLRGAPNGRPTEFVYYHRTDVDRSILTRMQTTTETFDCRLTIWVARPFAPFEVVLRNSPAYLESHAAMGLPPVSLGDPLLDAKFILSTTDPSVVPVLAQALAPLASVGVFHLRASEQSISYVMTMMESLTGFVAIEQVQYAMEQMASLLEGRSASSAIAS